MKSIAFVIPYFGKFNNYFQLWLSSCAANPTIDWLIFTDDKRKFEYPSNVHVSYTTLSETKHRFENALGCKICLEQPYKLCDFKPFYGVVYADELKGYDFWGYCDMDLIWGNIRKFLSEELLMNANKVFSYGHCTLIRNDLRINHFYELQADGVVNWKKVVTEPYSFLYDETNQINGIFKKYSSDTFYQGSKCFDAFYNSNALCPASHTMKETRIPMGKYIFDWSNGKLIGYCVKDANLYGQEFMYLHLQKRKMKQKTTNKNHFLILHDRFIDSIPITLQNIRILFPKVQFLPQRFKARIELLINVIFDNSNPKPYFRGRARYFFDKIFRRTQYYEYPYMNQSK